MAVNTTPAAAAENPAAARRDCMGFIGFLLDAIFDALQQAIDGALVGMAGSETPVETPVDHSWQGQALINAIRELG